MIGLCGLALHLKADPPTKAGQPGPAPPANGKRVTVEVSRDRARLLHDVFADTSDVVH